MIVECPECLGKGLLGYEVQCPTCEGNCEIDDPAIKTKQFAHQQEVYYQHRDDVAYALFWEMGLGKTKTVIDVASHLYLKGTIKQLVIIAPNSVYRNWVNEEIPAHMAVPHYAMNYPKKTTKRDTADRLMYLDPRIAKNELRVLSVSYDAIGKTKRGFEFVDKAVTMFPTMIVADEATALKKHKAKQTQNAKQIREVASVRWILTGTPATESPFQVHSMIEFIDEEFWAEFGLRTFTAFKSYFGIYTTQYFGNKKIPKIEGYRDLEKLNKLISRVSSRLLKEDSGVELPPKTYVKRTFELTPEQNRHYEDLLNDYMSELENGWEVQAILAISRIMRLQQITSGFVTAVDMPKIGDEVPEELPTEVFDIVEPAKNPRIKLLLEILEEARGKVIVWCRFTREVDQICSVLGDQAARYDGKTANQKRQDNLAAFKDPDGPRVFVANIDAVAYGITLTIAKTMIYYSNNFSLEKRLQSEDRNHRIGQDSPVLIVDIVAEREVYGQPAKTVDHHIVETLRNKFDIAAQVTGDKYREWIE